MRSILLRRILSALLVAVCVVTFAYDEALGLTLVPSVLMSFWLYEDGKELLILREWKDNYTPTVQLGREVSSLRDKLKEIEKTLHKD